MISVVITGADDPARLKATFASLGAAAGDGFVREVIAVTSDAAGVGAAEDAGAVLAVDQATALANARQPWLLILPAGARLELGWEQAAWRHINQHPGRAGWFRLSLKGGFGARLEEVRAGLEAGLLGRPRPEQGLLTPRGGAAGRRSIAARILA